MTDILEVLNMSDIADPVQVTKTKTAKPKLYHVVFLNDDFTPMDFVKEVLQQFFGKSLSDAIAITLEVHHHNKGIAGTYTYELAEQKVYETMELAGAHGYPLRLVTEPVD